MIISIHDSYQRRVAYMNNESPKALHYYNDTWRRLLAEATSTFTFTVDKTGLDEEKFLTEENYVSFMYKNKQYMFSIMKTEENENTIVVYAENLTLGLLNDTLDPIDVTQPQNLVWYLDQSGVLRYNGVQLGINEVPDLIRSIKIESEQTSLARLLIIAKNFEAEIEFVTELNREGTLKSLVVNFYKKFDGVNQGVGTNRQDLILEFGKNISEVKRTVDKTELFTMITPKGKDGLTITSLDRTEYDENGNIKFFTKPGQSSIYAPQSAQRYPSKLIRTNADYINHVYTADGTSDINTLYSLSRNDLEKHCLPAITYDVIGFYDLEIGDTVRILDTKFDPPLMISARSADQGISFTNKSQNKSLFGNIIALESHVSQDLTGRLKELVEQATPYRFEIVSDNGLTFKNSTGSTTLTARVYKGSNVDEVSVDSFEWLIDSVSFGGNAKSQLVNASQVTGTAVVRYNAKIGNTVIGGLEVTIQDISDGTDGVSPVNLVIDSSNGYQFKNNIINTTFTAILYQNNKEIDIDGTKFAYIWSKTKSDGTADTAWNLAHQSSQKTITITTSDVWQRATFDCTAEPLN